MREDWEEQGGGVGWRVEGIDGGGKGERVILLYY